jgi:hypothetical protein
MSWMVTIPATLRDQFLEKLQTTDPPGTNAEEPMKHEIAEQLVAAREAAREILASGAIGIPDYVQATLSGHANDNHRSSAGWANDVVTVTISCATPPTEPVDEEFSSASLEEEEPKSPAVENGPQED